MIKDIQHIIIQNQKYFGNTIFNRNPHLKNHWRKFHTTMSGLRTNSWQILTCVWGSPQQIFQEKEDPMQKIWECIFLIAVCLWNTIKTFPHIHNFQYFLKSLLYHKNFRQPARKDQSNQSNSDYLHLLLLIEYFQILSGERKRFQRKKFFIIFDY